MKNERDVKEAVKKILSGAGVWFFMPVQCGYGRYGIPDFICCCRGRFVAIETKFSNRKLTRHQERELHAIVGAGGAAMVITEKNLNLLKSLLEYNYVLACTD
jgi:hypothetical protein